MFQNFDQNEGLFQKFILDRYDEKKNRFQCIDSVGLCRNRCPVPTADAGGGVQKSAAAGPAAHNAWVGQGSRVTPKGPVRFMSPEYQALVQYALKECDRLGMTMGLQICKESGNK